MQWRERERGVGTLPPAWDLWTERERIVGCVIPARGAAGGYVVWHAHRSLSGIEAGCWDRRGNSHLGDRLNLDDAKRLVDDYVSAQNRA